MSWETLQERKMTSLEEWVEFMYPHLSLSERATITKELKRSNTGQQVSALFAENKKNRFRETDAARVRQIEANAKKYGYPIAYFDPQVQLHSVQEWRHMLFAGKIVRNYGNEKHSALARDKSAKILLADYLDIIDYAKKHGEVLPMKVKHYVIVKNGAVALVPAHLV